MSLIQLTLYNILHTANSTLADYMIYLFQV
jgi:hypothetical protein